MDVALVLARDSRPAQDGGVDILIALILGGARLGSEAKTRAAIRDRTVRGVESHQKVVAEDIPEGREAVREDDFFALFVSAAVIRDRDLVDRALQLRRLCGHFDFESES